MPPRTSTPPEPIRITTTQEILAQRARQELRGLINSLTSYPFVGEVTNNQPEIIFNTKEIIEGIQQEIEIVTKFKPKANRTFNYTFICPHCDKNC